MGFGEFLGNERTVSALRGMLRRERVPSALLFTGPHGIGKYTLARMFAQAANCERLKDDFCGACASCQRIAPLSHPAPLIEAGLAERGESGDAAAVQCVPPARARSVAWANSAPSGARRISSPKVGGAFSSWMVPTRCAGPMRTCFL